MSAVRWCGWFGLAGFFCFLVELPLWMLPGTPPTFSEAAAHTAFLAEHRVVALLRVMLDMAMYACMMVQFAGVRLAIARRRPDFEWLGTLVLVSLAVWWAVSLVADSMLGGAVLHTLDGETDPAIVRALLEGSILIYNGAIAFVVTGLCMGSAGVATLLTAAFPRWLGWWGIGSAVLCVAAVPAMFVPTVDHTLPYNAAGWIPTIVANVPPLIWFLAVSVAMIRWTDAPEG